MTRILAILLTAIGLAAGPAAPAAAHCIAEVGNDCAGHCTVSVGTCDGWCTVSVGHCDWYCLVAVGNCVLQTDQLLICGFLAELAGDYVVADVTNQGDVFLARHTTVDCPPYGA